MAMHELMVYAAGRGQFLVTYGGLPLVNRTRQPLLDGARVLLARGVGSRDRIGMRREGDVGTALSSTVGVAAALTVVERERGGGPYFEPWRSGAFVGKALVD
jgi:hypothetical protein